MNPTLTIDTGYQYFDNIVVYNRGTSDRIVGGTIEVIGTSSGTKYKFWTFDTVAPIYTFALGILNINTCYTH